MRLIFPATVLIFAIGFANLTATISPFVSSLERDDKVSEQLMQMERDWSAAYLKHNTSVISRMLADDYIGIDGRGIITNKAQEIEEAAAPALGTPPPARQVISDTVTDMKVRVYGEAAVITGRTIEKVLSNGKELDIQYRRTTVYVKRQGRWQCVSFHGSRIIEPPR